MTTGSRAPARLGISLSNEVHVADTLQLAWYVFGPEPRRGLELLAREVAPKL
jgi:hypothetical protein